MISINYYNKRMSKVKQYFYFDFTSIFNLNNQNILQFIKECPEITMD